MAKTKNKLPEEERRTRYTLTRADAMETDYFLLNNPVLTKGYAMAAAVGGAVSLKSAVLLSIAGALILLPVRILGDITADKVKARLRVIGYAILSALLSIPVMVLLTRLFGADVLLLGLYLPLIFIDTLVLSRSFLPIKEGRRLVYPGAFRTVAGYALALCLVGTVRELLSTGCLWEKPVFRSGIWSSAAGIPCGFVILALLCAFWQLICSAVRRILYIGGKEDE